MAKIPNFTGDQLIKRLAKYGFEVIRSKGSHFRLAHQDGRKTTIPVHGKEPIGTGLLVKILKDLDISKEEFFS